MIFKLPYSSNGKESAFEAGTSGFLSISDSNCRVPEELGQETLDYYSAKLAEVDKVGIFKAVAEGAAGGHDGKYASKFGKFSSSHRTGKGQFSFRSQRKAMPKNVQTTAQLHSTHTLAK